MNPHDSLPDLEAMRLGVSYQFKIKIRQWSCVLRPVTVGEHMAINAEVFRLLQEASDMNTAVNENYLLAKGFLKAASKLDPASTQEPRLNDFLLDRMSVDEVLYAYKQYLAGTELVNPELESLPVEILEALVEQVKKSPSAVIELSSLELTNLVRYLATKSG